MSDMLCDLDLVAQSDLHLFIIDLAERKKFNCYNLPRRNLDSPVNLTKCSMSEKAL